MIITATGKYSRFQCLFRVTRSQLANLLAEAADILLYLNATIFDVSNSNLPAQCLFTEVVCIKHRHYFFSLPPFLKIPYTVTRILSFILNVTCLVLFMHSASDYYYYKIPLMLLNWMNMSLLDRIRKMIQQM